MVWYNNILQHEIVTYTSCTDVSGGGNTTSCTKVSSGGNKTSAAVLAQLTVKHGNCFSLLCVLFNRGGSSRLQQTKDKTWQSVNREKPTCTSHRQLHTARESTLRDTHCQNIHYMVCIQPHKHSNILHHYIM